jgi:hypothetical protein
MQKSLGMLLVLFALALAACSGGGSAGSPLSLPGLSITTPSPTPPTPMPTATQNNALKDGDFESGAFSATAGWTACSIAHPNVTSTAVPLPTPFPAIAPPSTFGAAIVSPTSPPFQVAATPAPATKPAIFAGSFAALTWSGTGAQTTFGGAGTSSADGLSGICQTITIPAGASLTMFVNEGGSDSKLSFADQEADIVPATGANAGVAIPLFVEFNAASVAGKAQVGGVPPNQTSTAGGTYVEKGPYALTAAPYNLTAGQTAQLFIGVFDSEPSAGFGAYMFVDDVNLTGPSVPASISRTTPMNARTSTK